MWERDNPSAEVWAWKYSPQELELVRTTFRPGRAWPELVRRQRLGQCKEIDNPNFHRTFRAHGPRGNDDLVAGTHRVRLPLSPSRKSASPSMM
jgi:hypothetical protein